MAAHERDVSVLVPSYNSGPYVVSAIESALQSDVNVEVVVQDGGSTDATLESLAAITDPRLGVVSEPDAGQSDALNRALARATGEYVIWLNADDLLAPGALAKLTTAARLDDLDLVHGNYEIIDSGGEVVKPYTSAPLELKRLIRHRMYIFSGAILMRRNVLRELGGFDQELHFCMDYELLLRLASSPATRGEIPDIVAAFRRQPDAKSEVARIPFIREQTAVARRHGATRREALRNAAITTTYLMSRPVWRSRLWLRIRPEKHLGGEAPATSQQSK